MKTRSLVLFLGLSALAMVSCSSPKASSANEPSTKSETSQSSSSETSDSKTSEPSTQTTSDSSQSQSQEDPKNGLLDRARQLAENIDKMPKVESLYVADSASLKARKNAEIIDETNPSQDVLEHPALNVYYEDTWNFIDNQINNGISIKNEAVARVFMLNQWVMERKEPSYQAGLKLTYDANLDAALVEQMRVYDTEQRGVQGKDYDYVRICSFFGPSGEANVDYLWTCAFLPDGESELQLGNKLMISFRENAYWDVTLSETDPFSETETIYIKTIIHADLSKEEREVTQVQKVTIVEEGRPIQNDIRPAIQTVGENLISVVEMQGDMTATCYLYNREGYAYLISNQDLSNPGRMISIPLYRLTGYDRIENHYEGDDEMNGTRYLIVGDQVYGGNEQYDYQGCEWFIDAQASGVTAEPVIRISLRRDQATIENAPNFIRELLASIGLSPKEDLLEEAIRLEFGKMDVCENREALGKVGYRSVTDEEFDSIFERYDVVKIGEETFFEYDQAEKIMRNQQTTDTTPYRIIDSTAVGAFSYDEEAQELAIGETSIEVPATPFLSKNTQYKGVVALKSSRSLIPVATSDVVEFDGTNDMSVTIPASRFPVIDIPFLGEEAFELVAYLALVGGNGESETLMRITAADYLSYEGEDIDCVLTVPEEEGSSDSESSDGKPNKPDSGSERNQSIYTDRFKIVREDEHVYLIRYFIFAPEGWEPQTEEPSSSSEPLSSEDSSSEDSGSESSPVFPDSSEF